MKANKIKTFYRHNLPHLQPIGAAFFVTFRLKDSIPRAKLSELKQAFEAKKKTLLRENTVSAKQELMEHHHRFFLAYDKLLEDVRTGPHYLKDPKIALMVTSQLHRFDGELYDLVAYCIMSNHVHILIDTSLQIPEEQDLFNFEQMDFEPLERIMKRIKGASARYANLELDRAGSTFWQKESYDRFIRNEMEFDNVIGYILNNPVKAGIVKKWDDFPFTFYKYTQ
ncbi:MAG: hypothetical protein KDC85_21640 [Saprospiraceae bacterium]|nr:hypothetical protein [Saprospiraceae bacterium]MCB9324373.1 hypothetical protein [Lewinellaceae bacterium]